MKSLPHTIHIFNRFFLLLCLLLFAVAVHAAQFQEDVSSDQCLYAKGIIKSVSPDHQMIELKQKDGPTISLSIDQDTIFEGFYKLTELKPRQKLKVWYQPKEQENQALKIVKPLDLGC